LINDINRGSNLEAQDKYGKWYVGIVVDKVIEIETNSSKVKVHFYNFPDKWDEWYGDEKLNKLAPLGKNKPQFKDKVWNISTTHRRILQNEENQT
jgi:hypothetical protein